MNRMLQWAWFLLTFFVLAGAAVPQYGSNAGTDSLKNNLPQRFQPSNYYLQKSRFAPNRGIFSGNQGAAGKASQLPVFGFDLFRRPTSPVSGQEARAFTLPANYALGPGDRIGVYLLGTVQQNMDVMVNVEGKIFLPPAGVIHVWGMKMDEFRTLLSRRLSQYYDNFTLDIMLLQPKNVMVVVVGDVQQPGKYVLSALNTVLDAVIMAGGPTPNGSLRDIQLIRAGERFTAVDLYAFLMSGQTNEDAFLQAGDRIYVPLSQHRVSIAGEVKRPSIFELKPGGKERLSDLIELAGGFTDFAFLDKIEISRLQEHGHRTLSYTDYNDVVSGDSTYNLLLQNHDSIRVYSKLEQIHERQVSIFGEIRSPGTYVLQDNMHLSDLILKAGSLTREAYRLEAQVARIDPGEPTTFLKVSLDEMTNGANGGSDIILAEDDQVFIRRIPEWEVGLLVEVRGEVMFPGKYAIVKDSTYLSDILQQADGFTEDAFLQEAYVLRPSTHVKFDQEFERLKEMRREEMSDLEYQYFVMRQNSAEIEQVVVNFEKLVYEKDRSEDIIMEHGDIIVVPRAPKVVTVTGSVARPGGVTYVPGATKDYYLGKAGGASWDAQLRKTKIIKVTGEVLDDEDVDEFEPGDIIWVPRKSDKKFWPVFLQTVTVAAQLASIYLIIDRSLD